MQEITIEELHRILKEGEDGGCCLIDVRTAEEFNAGHVPGAKLICLREIERHTHEFPRDRDVYLICRSGMRSAKALALLRERYGFRRLFNVAGGTLAWTKAGLPLEH
jgi:Rhodanese-related sulfurtransferase